MASILLTLQGRPYMAYVPGALEKCRGQLMSNAVRFRDFDVRLMGSASNPDWNAAIENMVSSADLSGDSSRSQTHPRPPLNPVVEFISGKKRLSVNDLAEANRRVRGIVRAALRSRPVWMDAGHPADSWYVAAPADRLKAKLRDLCALVDDATFPVTLRACVTMLLLLQLHPFEDGNGRTARVVYAAIVKKGAGLAAPAIAALAEIWAHRGMRLHAASLHLRDSGDWSPYLNLCAGALERQTG